RDASARLLVISEIFGCASSRMACAAESTGAARCSMRLATFSMRSELFSMALYNKNNSTSCRQNAAAVTTTNTVVTVFAFTVFYIPQIHKSIEGSITNSSGLFLPFAAGSFMVSLPTRFKSRCKLVFLAVDDIFAALYPLPHGFACFSSLSRDVFLAFLGSIADGLARLAA